MNIYAATSDLSNEPVESRIALAESTPRPKILEKLAKDPEWGVRQAVARNPEAGEELLQQLMQDSDSDVRLAALIGWLKQDYESFESALSLVEEVGFSDNIYSIDSLKSTIIDRLENDDMERAFNIIDGIYNDKNSGWDYWVYDFEYADDKPYSIGDIDELIEYLEERS